MSTIHVITGGDYTSSTSCIHTDRGVAACQRQAAHAHPWVTPRSRRQLPRQAPVAALTHRRRLTPTRKLRRAPRRVSAASPLGRGRNTPIAVGGTRRRGRPPRRGAPGPVPTPAAKTASRVSRGDHEKRTGRLRGRIRAKSSRAGPHRACERSLARPPQPRGPAQSGCGGVS